MAGPVTSARDLFRRFMKDWSAESRRLLWILLAIAVVQLTAEVLLDGFTSFPDSNEYIETVEWFKDGSGIEYPLRIQRPLQIVAVLLFEPLLGVVDAFILTNCIFYVASVPFFFSFSRKLLKDDWKAFVSTFLFMTSFCVLYWGLALLTDMLLWFLICVSFSLLADVKERWRPADVYKLAIIVGIGALNKESIVAAGLVLLYLLMLKPAPGGGPKSRKAVDFALAVGVMALPFLLVQLAMYLQFGPGYTFFDYHITHKTGEVRGSLLYLLATFAIAFNILLLAYPFGVGRFLTLNGMLSKKDYIVSFILCLLPVVAFEQYSPRLSFLVFPLVIPVAVLGLERLALRISPARAKGLILAFMALYALAGNAAALFGDELRDLLGIWSR